MKVLLVYDMVPDEVRMYLIQDPTEGQIDALKAVDRTYLGADETPEQRCIAAAISGDFFFDTRVPEDWHGIWSRCEVETPIETQIDMVVITGSV